MIRALRRLLAAALSACLLAAMAGCGRPSAPPPSPTFAARGPVSVGDGTWSVTVLRCETADDLNGTEASMQYNGTSTTIRYEERPADGHTFLLLEATIEKTRAGTARFAWDSLLVEDAGGQGYARMENDTFLGNFHFERIKSTDLTFGRNTGFLCFEIPTGAADGPLTLVYATVSATTRIPLR